jgi:hypothetical protein
VPESMQGSSLLARADKDKGGEMECEQLVEKIGLR